MAGRTSAAAGLASDPLLTPAVQADLAQARRRLRRNGIVFIVIFDVLIAAVGVAAASDLLSMRTPAGAAGSWADAATAGDCDRYLDLETPQRRADELAASASVATANHVSREHELCVTVSGAWNGYSVDEARLVRQQGAEAVVMVSLSDGSGGAAGNGAAGGGATGGASGELLMTKTGGRWRVDEAQPPCDAPALTPAAALCSSIALP